MLFQIKTDESKELLNHPVVRLLLRHKQKATRLIYWVNFFIIPTLLILVTGHSLFIPPPFYVQAAGDGSNYTWLADGQTKWQDNLDPIALFLFGKIGTWIILTLTVIYFMLFVRKDEASVKLSFKAWSQSLHAAETAGFILKHT